MNIVLFDGVCNLCNSTILFLIKHDANHNLHFAATQTESGKKLMRQYNILDEEKSVFFIKEGIVFSKSNAVIEIAKAAGFSISAGDLLRNQAKGIMELSDEELENVAGGADCRGRRTFLPDRTRNECR